MTGSCARTEILLGQQGLARLAESHVLIAGLGGVGGACAEALCRFITIINECGFAGNRINAIGNKI